MNGGILLGMTATPTGDVSSARVQLNEDGFVVLEGLLDPDLVRDLKSRVEPMVERGMTYDQVAAANPTAAYNDRYGDPERFLRAVYSELGGEL